MSFHAYFLIFSRNYTEFIEQKINKEFDNKILIAHELENDYFFPTKQKKMVVAVLNKNFSWFSFVTLFITTYGFSSYLWSMYMIYVAKLNLVYLYFVIGITVITLVVGYWWFISCTGEKRLERIFQNNG